jgi:hypothetical protein
MSDRLANEICAQGGAMRTSGWSSCRNYWTCLSLLKDYPWPPSFRQRP